MHLQRGPCCSVRNTVIAMQGRAPAPRDRRPREAGPPRRKNRDPCAGRRSARVPGGGHTGGDRIGTPRPYTCCSMFFFVQRCQLNKVKNQELTPPRPTIKCHPISDSALLLSVLWPSHVSTVSESLSERSGGLCSPQRHARGQARARRARCRARRPEAAEQIIHWSWLKSVTGAIYFQRDLLLAV